MEMSSYFKIENTFWYIFFFHLGITIYTFISFLFDEIPFSIHYAYPILLAVFTLVWYFIAQKKVWAFYLYFAMTLAEYIIQVRFQHNLYGDLFGKILFPLDIIFCIVLLLLYKHQFTNASGSAGE